MIHSSNNLKLTEQRGSGRAACGIDFAAWSVGIKLGVAMTKHDALTNRSSFPRPARGSSTLRAGIGLSEAFGIGRGERCGLSLLPAGGRQDRHAPPVAWDPSAAGPIRPLASEEWPLAGGVLSAAADAIDCAMVAPGLKLRDAAGGLAAELRACLKPIVTMTTYSLGLKPVSDFGIEPSSGARSALRPAADASHWQRGALFEPAARGGASPASSVFSFGCERLGLGLGMPSRPDLFRGVRGFKPCRPRLCSSGARVSFGKRGACDAPRPF